MLGHMQAMALRDLTTKGARNRLDSGLPQAIKIMIHLQKTINEYGPAELTLHGRLHEQGLVR